MTSDTWSLKGRNVIVCNMTGKGKNIQKEEVVMYHLKDIETLRHKIIEDITKNISKIMQTYNITKYTIKASNPEDASLQDLVYLINKRFGIEETKDKGAPC